MTCLDYWPETFHTLIKLPPRVTFPQILDPRLIIQDLKNDPIFVWELLLGPKTVMVSLTNALWGWFGGPPGVLQMTHPMGPSTDTCGYRRSKCVKTRPTSEQRMTSYALIDWAQNAICCRFWTKKFFESLSRGGSPQIRPLEAFKVRSLFFISFFQMHFFPSICNQPICQRCQKFSLGLNFSKMMKKVGKMHLNHFQPSKRVFDLLASQSAPGRPTELIFGLQPDFDPKKIYPKFHQFWTTGWPVVAAFWSKNLFFC